MQQLKLYRYADWYMTEMRKVFPKDYCDEKAETLYTCLGEFAHAPGHHLMCEFGTWKMIGMQELDNFEELERHPDDFSVTLDAEE